MPLLGCFASPFTQSLPRIWLISRTRHPSSRASGGSSKRFELSQVAHYHTLPSFYRVFQSWPLPVLCCHRLDDCPYSWGLTKLVLTTKRRYIDQNRYIAISWLVLLPSNNFPMRLAYLKPASTWTTNSRHFSILFLIWFLANNDRFVYQVD